MEDGLRRFEFEAIAMGCPFRIVLEGRDEREARAVAQKAFAAIRALEEVFSDYREDSELRRFEARAAEGFQPLSEALASSLLEAQAIALWTQGAFDPTIAPLVRLWREHRRLGVTPSEEALQRAREAVGIEGLEFARAAPFALPRAARFLRQGCALDLGGIAKGQAAQAALDLLAGEGFARALVDAGGDLAIGAAPAGQAGWRVAVPAFGQSPGLKLELRHLGVATSGDAARSFTLRGRTYGHLLDPRRGEHLLLAHQVTVIARSASLADALATAFSIETPERAIALAESRAGVEVRIAHVDGRIWQTCGFAQHLARP